MVMWRLLRSCAHWEWRVPRVQQEEVASNKQSRCASLDASFV